MANDDALHFEFSLDKPAPIDLSASQEHTEAHDDEDEKIGMFNEHTSGNPENPDNRPSFFSSLLKKKKLLISGGIIAVLSIVTGYVLQGGMFFKTQFISDPTFYERSGSFKLALENPDQKLKANDEFTINILANSNNEKVASFDIIITFDPTYIEAVDQDPATDGIQADFAPMPGIGSNVIDNTTGEVTLRSYDFGAGFQKGQDTNVGAIEFKAKKDGTSNISIVFENDGAILQNDSNMLMELSNKKDCSMFAAGCQFDILGSIVDTQVLVGNGTTTQNPDPLKATIVSPSSKKTVNVNETIEFEGEINGGTPPYSITWDFGNSGLSESTKLKPGKLVVKKDGSFDVALKVTDAKNASSEDSVKIVVEEDDDDDDDNNNNNSQNRDSDGDGIKDTEEVIPGVDGYITDPFKADTDGDGYNDYVEIQNGYDPTIPDNSSPFVDVPVSSNFFKYINKLYHNNIVKGYDSTHFGPKGNTSRFELVKLVLLSFEIPVESNLPQKFQDVLKSSEAYNYMHTAEKLGILKGSNGRARPWDPVTRAEAVKIIVNTLVSQNKLTLEAGSSVTFFDVPTTNEFAPYIATATKHSIVSGYENKTFLPYRSILREEIAKIIAQSMTL